MQNTTPRTVFDVITDFLATEPTPQQIIDYALPDDLQARLDELLDKNRESKLTSAEREEIDAYLNTNRFFSMLKAKMKLKLQQATDESE